MPNVTFSAASNIGGGTSKLDLDIFLDGVNVGRIYDFGWDGFNVVLNRRDLGNFLTVALAKEAIEDALNV